MRNLPVTTHSADAVEARFGGVRDARPGDASTKQRQPRLDQGAVDQSSAILQASEAPRIACRGRTRPDRASARHVGDGCAWSPVRGSAAWVRLRLQLNGAALGVGTAHDRAAELTDWMYAVVRRRATAAGVVADERDDVVQDAMLQIWRLLKGSRARLGLAENPAAVIERVAARAVCAGRHRVGMSGLGGVAPNGRNWRARYPRRIGGDTAMRIVSNRAEPRHETCREVESATARIVSWVSVHVGVVLTADAEQAIIYILERLIDGVSRASLVRGSHSALGIDIAMRHLGFDPAAAGAFAVWLLGRADQSRRATSVLDAALLGAHFEEDERMRWRRQSLELGFASQAL
jgi:hypothetical protein